MRSVGATRRRWGYFDNCEMRSIHGFRHEDLDPQTVSRRPDRPQRVGQEHLRAQALPAHRGSVVGRLPWHGQRRREQSGRDERSLRGLALHRGQAAGAGPADRDRRHQRAARSPQAAGRACSAVPLPAGRHRAEPARRDLSGAQSAAGRTGLRSPRRSPATVATAPVAAWPGQRGFPPVFVLETPEEVEAATVERVPL